MYASYDVEKLNRLYPHGKISGLDISYELKEKKPKAWVNLRSISKFAKWAIVLSEDWGFYQHQGIDINQIKSAFSEMLAGERFRGASTITQQMVKNIYLTEDRTLWRKLHEIILAQKVERVMSKDRILEIYLNSIEYGPGIFGINQASYHYFKKHPSALTAKEGAFLAMLLPSPKKYYVSFKKRRLTTFARERIQNILVKMRMGKVISPDQHSSLKDVRLSWEK
jgi:monofunctional glycosyltransferase